MSKYKIQFSKDAREDLINLYSYIKYNLNESIIAEKMIKKIRKEINKIKENPTIYAIIKEEMLKKEKSEK